MGLQKRRRKNAKKDAGVRAQHECIWQNAGTPFDYFPQIYQCPSIILLPLGYFMFKHANY